MSPAIKDYTFPRQHPCLQLQGRRITLSPGNTLDSTYKEGEFHCYQATAPLSPATRKENSTVTTQHPPMSPATRKENSTLKRQCHWSRTLTSRRSVLQASSTTLFHENSFPRNETLGCNQHTQPKEGAGGSWITTAVSFFPQSLHANSQVSEFGEVKTSALKDGNNEALHSQHS